MLLRVGSIVAENMKLLDKRLAIKKLNKNKKGTIALHIATMGLGDGGCSTIYVYIWVAI